MVWIRSYCSCGLSNRKFSSHIQYCSRYSSAVHRVTIVIASKVEVKRENLFPWIQIHKLNIYLISLIHLIRVFFHSIGTVVPLTHTQCFFFSSSLYLLCNPFFFIYFIIICLSINLERERKNEKKKTNCLFNASLSYKSLTNIHSQSRWFFSDLNIFVKESRRIHI